MQQHLPLRSLNHISTVVSSVPESVDFYVRVLGFQEIVRPQAFKFDGAWLWRRGMSLHLIDGTPQTRSPRLDPCTDHISFQADTSLEDCEQRLRALGIRYVRQSLVECGVRVDQIFFHTPDRLMIEVCNCECLPVLPLGKGCTTEHCPPCTGKLEYVEEGAASIAASEASDGTAAAAGRMSVDSVRYEGAVVRSDMLTVLNT